MENPMLNRFIRPLGTLAAVVMLLAGSGCAELNAKKVLEVNKPTAKVESVKLTGLDFQTLDLAFDIALDNPNPVSLQLGGLDYNLKLAGESFLKGVQNESLNMAASGTSHVQLPLSLNFNDLYKTFQTLGQRDTIPYELDLGLKLDIPILGQMRFPVQKSGEFPVPRPPRIALADMRVSSMSLLGAELDLVFEVDNPNTFSLALDRLNYALSVNGQPWVKTGAANIGRINANGVSRITLPVKLNFSEVGMGIYTALNSGKGLNYSVKGLLDATSSNAFVGAFQLPFDNSGSVKVGM